MCGGLELLLCGQPGVIGGTRPSVTPASTLQEEEEARRRRRCESRPLSGCDTAGRRVNQIRASLTLRRSDVLIETPLGRAARRWFEF